MKIASNGHVRRWFEHPTSESFSGFINTVHRETRDLHLAEDCHPTLTEAKRYLPIDEEICILELTAEGGGSKIWMREEQKSLLQPRLAYHARCYGQWSVWTLNSDFIQGGI